MIVQDYYSGWVIPLKETDKLRELTADEKRLIETMLKNAGLLKQRPKNRTVVVERNGKITTVPYSVAFDEDGRKIITSEPDISQLYKNGDKMLCMGGNKVITSDRVQEN